KLAVLLLATFRFALLEEYAISIDFERVGSRAAHQVEPIGVLGRGVIVRATILADHERVLVTINRQRHVRHVAIVEPVARDSAAGGPATKMSGTIGEAIREFTGLPLRVLVQPTKHRWNVGGYGSWPGRCLTHRHHFLCL